MDIVPWYKKRLRWLGKSYKNIDALLREIDVIPFHVARQLLAPMTWQEFVDMLNIPSNDKRHLVTEAEEDFRDYEKTNPGAPFFRKREIVDSYLHEHTPERHEYMERFFNIEYDEWLRWIERNPDMLPESRLSQEPVFVTVEEARSVISKYQQMLSQYDTALGHEKAENEALKARIAELENEAQKDAESEEITSLYRELGNLEISLEASEEARQGLSHELEVKTLELVRLRQELEDLKAIHGEGPKLRTMWRYVLELEARGMTDADIRNALKGDGFHNPAIDALLYPGTGANYNAVTKHFQRH